MATSLAESLDTIETSQVSTIPSKSTAAQFRSIEKSTHKELTRIIWGDCVKEEVFERWSQGFIFSNKEATALLQLHGGPCAVLAPVQAYLLKDLFFTNSIVDWRNLNETDLNKHLTNSLLSVYLNFCTDDSKYLVIYDNVDEEEEEQQQVAVATNHQTEAEVATTAKTAEHESPTGDNNSSAKRIKLDHSGFIDKLKVFKCGTLNELKIVLHENIVKFRKRYGVLCFLYSIILTKGLEKIKSELEEGGDQLIDALHGHGSQSLINLMICGSATSYVFDGEKSLEGYALHGVSRQSTIGFLTIMENYRYCEVGWFLKNPKYPIWILASETHLTVFFSKETSLIQKDESARQKAIKGFRKYDANENGFVQTDDLQKLMESLELFSEQEYVDIVKQQLDTENLGIITQAAFLDKFYPETTSSHVLPGKFTVYHYNGLPRSNKDNEVEYVQGQAELKDFDDQPSPGLNSIKSCLQTKWPTMEITWENDKIPSLN